MVLLYFVALAERDGAQIQNTCSKISGTNIREHIVEMGYKQHPLDMHQADNTGKHTVTKYRCHNYERTGQFSIARHTKQKKKAQWRKGNKAGINLRKRQLN
jgi:hypothetical protein